MNKNELKTQQNISINNKIKNFFYNINSSFCFKAFLLNIRLLIPSFGTLFLAIVLILLPIIYPIVSFVVKNNPSDFSWIYAIILSISLCIFYFISIYRLFISSKTDGFNDYFNSKGLFNWKLKIIRILSIFSLSTLFIIISSIVLAITFASFGFSNSIGSFVLMSLFGSLLFQLFILPIFLFIAIYSSSIFFIIICTLITLTPISSIASRINTNNTNDFIYSKQKSTNYVTAYDFSNNSKTTYVVGYLDYNIKNNNVFYSIIPGEIMISPLTLLYVPNISDGVDENTLKSNIYTSLTRYHYVESESKNIPITSQYQIFMRPIDTNIFELSFNDAKKIIIDDLKSFYNNNNNINFLDNNKYDDLANDMLYDYPNIYYTFLFKYLANKYSTITNIYDIFSKVINSVISEVKSYTSGSFANFISYYLEASNANNLSIFFSQLKEKNTDKYPFLYNTNKIDEGKKIQQGYKIIHSDIQKINTMISYFESNKVDKKLWINILTNDGKYKKIDFIAFKDKYIIDFESKKNNEWKNVTPIFSNDAENLLNYFLSSNIGVSQNLDEWTEKDFNNFINFIANYENKNIGYDDAVHPMFTLIYSLKLYVNNAYNLELTPNNPTNQFIPVSSFGYIKQVYNNSYLYISIIILIAITINALSFSLSAKDGIFINDDKNRKRNIKK